MRAVFIGRLFGLLFAMVCLGIATWSGVESSKMYTEFRQWIDAQPMESSIDLSEVGEQTVSFEQTCSSAHGELLSVEFFEHPGSRVSQPEINVLGVEESGRRESTETVSTDWFAGLSGSISIHDTAGKEVHRADFTADSVQSWDGQFVLTILRPFEVGSYQATIRVKSPAVALHDKPHRTSAAYHLCGLEQLPSLVAGAISFFTGLIGITITLSVVPAIMCGRFAPDQRPTAHVAIQDNHNSPRPQ